MVSQGKKPLIGVSCATKVVDGWGLYSRSVRVDLLIRAYTESLEKAGASVVLIPELKDREGLARILDGVDGVLFSGGPDIAPRHYGEQMLPGLQQVDYLRDASELELASQALASDLPLLGICRGIQMLAVAAGGTLYQDIPTQVPEALLHRSPADIATLAHEVEIKENTRLKEIIGAPGIWVNSGHHQAVKALPEGFVASAQAPDGVIEAMELPGKRFCLAVQWHPEGLYDEDLNAEKIFRAFVGAASGF